MFYSILNFFNCRAFLILCFFNILTYLSCKFLCFFVIFSTNSYCCFVNSLSYFFDIKRNFSSISFNNHCNHIYTIPCIFYQQHIQYIVIF